MTKRIEVVCSPEIKAILLEALRNYTDVAFPCGCADCSLVAREAMLDALTGFEREYDDGGTGRAGYNKRLRAMFKEGVRLHYRLLEADCGHTVESECQLLLDVVEGTPRDDADLAAARSADRVQASPDAAAQTAGTGSRK
jgi:hypothetical protein